MNKPTDNASFQSLTFDDFRHLATTDSIDSYVSSGFQPEHRIGYELTIFQDIASKLYPYVSSTFQTKALEVGPGLTPLVGHHIQYCHKNNIKLHLLDSAEVLDQLPHDDKIVYLPGRLESLNLPKESFHFILLYSVIQHIYLESNIFLVLTKLINTLKPGGRILIGDIPNIDAVNRFLTSSAGLDYHKKNYGDIPYRQLTISENPTRLCDEVITSMLSFARSLGCHSYMMPQSRELPYYPRRDDILICKP